MGRISVRHDQRHAADRQRDAEHLAPARPPPSDETGPEQHHDRSQILKDRPDSRRGELDRKEIEKLTSADTGQTVEEQIPPESLIPPGSEQPPSVPEQTVDEEDHPRGTQPDRNQPPAVHSLVAEQVLAHAPRAAPADASEDGEQGAGETASLRALPSLPRPGSFSSLFPVRLPLSLRRAGSGR